MQLVGQKTQNTRGDGGVDRAIWGVFHAVSSYNEQAIA
jgi:hypothetical protein